MSFWTLRAAPHRAGSATAGAPAALPALALGSDTRGARARHSGGDEAGHVALRAALHRHSLRAST